LRFLQEKTIERVGGTRTVKLDVRILCATNRDLKTLIDAGKFREDLYYRINVITIGLPPLRDRPEDIPDLVDYFLKRLEREIQKKGVFDEESMGLLQIYDWRGNVRELENVVERALVLSEGATIRAKDLPVEIRGGDGAQHDAYYESTGLSAQIE